MRFAVDTVFYSDSVAAALTTGVAAVPTSNVTVWIAYLKSYRHMGVASVACVMGCTCGTVKLDGHRNEPASASTADVGLAIETPGVKCVLQVTSLQETNSPEGEHKFKVISAAVQILI